MESIIRGEKCSGLIANGAIWIMADFREELLLLPLTWSSGEVSSDHRSVSGAVESNHSVQTLSHIIDDGPVFVFFFFNSISLLL